MNPIQTQSFIQFLLEQNVLKFGEFTLNSGRVSPYFFNLGSITLGGAYAKLGAAYAEALQVSDLPCDVLFGPAYKGIPIAVSTALALAEQRPDIEVAYNRKEEKDHGEGGRVVGNLTGNVVLVDDVLTSGKALRGAAALIDDSAATLAGVVIALDRQEVFNGDKTAVMELQEELDVPVISITKMQDIVSYLDNGDKDRESVLSAMREYQREYCM